jgi:hypothetical protein
MTTHLIFPACDHILFYTQYLNCRVTINLVNPCLYISNNISLISYY